MLLPSAYCMYVGKSVPSRSSCLLGAQYEYFGGWIWEVGQRLSSEQIITVFFRANHHLQWTVQHLRSLGGYGAETRESTHNTRENWNGLVRRPRCRCPERCPSAPQWPRSRPRNGARVLLAVLHVVLVVPRQRARSPVSSARTTAGSSPRPEQQPAPRLLRCHRERSPAAAPQTRRWWQQRCATSGRSCTRNHGQSS